MKKLERIRQKEFQTLEPQSMILIYAGAPGGTTTTITISPNGDLGVQTHQDPAT